MSLSDVLATSLCLSVCPSASFSRTPLHTLAHPRPATPVKHTNFRSLPKRAGTLSRRRQRSVLSAFCRTLGPASSRLQTQIRMHFRRGWKPAPEWRPPPLPTPRPRVPASGQPPSPRTCPKGSPLPIRSCLFPPRPGTKPCSLVLLTVMFAGSDQPLLGATLRPCPLGHDGGRTMRWLLAHPSGVPEDLPLPSLRLKALLNLSL